MMSIYKLMNRGLNLIIILIGMCSPVMIFIANMLIQNRLVSGLNETYHELDADYPPYFQFFILITNTEVMWLLLFYGWGILALLLLIGFISEWVYGKEGKHVSSINMTSGAAIVVTIACFGYALLALMAYVDAIAKVT
jgi:hypothetical protein